MCFPQIVKFEALVAHALDFELYHDTLFFKLSKKSDQKSSFNNLAAFCYLFQTAPTNFQFGNMYNLDIIQLYKVLRSQSYTQCYLQPALFLSYESNEYN